MYDLAGSYDWSLSLSNMFGLHVVLSILWHSLLLMSMHFFINFFFSFLSVHHHQWGKTNKWYVKFNVKVSELTSCTYPGASKNKKQRVCYSSKRLTIEELGICGLKQIFSKPRAEIVNKTPFKFIATIGSPFSLCMIPWPLISVRIQIFDAMMARIGCGQNKEIRRRCIQHLFRPDCYGN